MWVSMARATLSVTGSSRFAAGHSSRKRPTVPRTADRTGCSGSLALPAKCVKAATVRSAKRFERTRFSAIFSSGRYAMVESRSYAGASIAFRPSG